MNIKFQIVFAAMMVQAVFAVTASAQAARPVAVNMTVGEISNTAHAISEAVSAGDNLRAEELLSQLYSAGGRAEEAVPVYAAHSCCQCAAQPSAAAPAPVTAAAPAAAAVAPAPAVMTYTEALAAKEKAAADKKKEKDDEAKEKARQQKQFNWSVTLMTVALLLLVLL